MSALGIITLVFLSGLIGYLLHDAIHRKDDNNQF